MSIHKATVNIPTVEIQRINRLLSIDDLGELTDDELIEIGANTYDWDGVYSVVFDDGSTLSCDLCSGSTNYYDDINFQSANGKTWTLDCEYELDDIEFDYGDEHYIVEIVEV